MSLVGEGTWRGTRGDQTALRDDVENYSWAELDQLLNHAINALLTRDLGPERRVAVFAENSALTAIAYLTGVLAGCSGVPINYHLRADECAHILRDSSAGLLFVGPATLATGLQAARRAGGIPVIAWGVEPGAGFVTWESFVESGDGGEPPDDLRPLPYLHYTSGTTGFPKGIKTPPGLYPGGEAATVREHVEAMVAEIPRDEGPHLTIAPMYHSGQLSPIKRAALAGRAHIIHRRFDPEATLATIDRDRVGTVLMVPTHFVRLLALPAEVRRRYDVSSMRQLRHVGASCPIDVKHEMIDWFGPVLYEGYGATEQGVVSHITSAEWLEHPGSVGRVREGLELHVVDDDGRELGPNEIGRLYFRDLSGFDVEFHNDQAKTDSVHLRPGIWTIGEVGYVDDEGFLFITDRFSDMVISGGVNIYPAEAEQAMLQLPDVADVACIGVPHPDLGEVLEAIVLPANLDALPDPEVLIAQTQERLSKYKCPRSVRFVADLGRSPLGKVNKKELRARLESGELEPLASRDKAGTT